MCMGSDCGSVQTLVLYLLPVCPLCLLPQHKQQAGSKDLDCVRGLADQQPFKGYAGLPDPHNSNSSKKEHFFPLVSSQQQQLQLVQSVSDVCSSKADDIELCFGDDGSRVASRKINLIAGSGDSSQLSPQPHTSTGISGFSGDTGASDTGSSVMSYWYHVWVLMVRFAKSWVRTPIMAVAEAIQYVILSLFLGLLYLRSPLALPNAPFDRMGAMFVVLTMLSLTPSYTVLVMWDHERQLLRRETSTNMYKRYAGLLLLVIAPCSASLRAPAQAFTRACSFAYRRCSYISVC
jgi:hypothetical protein